MVADTPAAHTHPLVAGSLDRGFTLPAGWYTSAAVFEQEKVRIFQRFWQYVGHVERVSQRGDFFGCTLGDVPIVVLRDTDGTLRAFANRGRPHGSRLVMEAEGSQEAIHCQYRGLTWRLDGTLLSPPSEDKPSVQRPEESPLIPLRMETWGPLIFVNPDPQAGPLSAVLQELPAIVAATGLDLHALRFRLRREYEIAANWKVVAENFNECYHCPVAHPSFSDLIDIDTYKVVTAYEWFSTQHGGVRPSAMEGQGQGIYDVGEEVLSSGVKDGCFSLIFPSSMIVVNPGPHNLGVLALFPLDAHRTLERRDTFFSADVPDDEVQAIVDFGWQVFQEDVTLCESVQRGMRSGLFDQGRLMLSRENGIQHFQGLVHRVLCAP